jgi:DNA-binding transcriptional ArsR family regulator
MTPCVVLFRTSLFGRIVLNSYNGPPPVPTVNCRMPLLGRVEQVADTFKVLGDPTRLRIAHALAREELCVCDLATLLSTSQSTISHSLRALRQMRLVRYRKDGKIAYYSLDDEHITRILGVAFEHIEESA